MVSEALRSVITGRQLSENKAETFDSGRVNIGLIQQSTTSEKAPATSCQALHGDLHTPIYETSADALNFRSTIIEANLVK